MAEVVPISEEESQGWYETLQLSHSGSGDLDADERAQFNAAFEMLSRQSYSGVGESFAELATRGCSLSPYFLGLMHQRGTGVLQDFCLAHMWFNIAASRGNRRAVDKLVKLTESMTAEQVAEAQKMARKWVTGEG